jgi:short-subunit dehydrogenase
MSDQKVVLITGASSGVGQSTARLLARNGYKVFGTSRKLTSAEPLPNLEMLALDVRADDSVADCVKAVSSRGGRLDVLVNNAGYELAGALEETSLDEAKAQFETNFFGVVRMVRAALPLMRQQKHGQIINISSLSGLSPIPFMGMYSASKFAVEGYTEALHLELKPLGIHVSQVEAGFLKTPMMDKRQVAAERIREYDPWRQRAFDAIREYEEKGPGPELVAETVLKIIAGHAPRLRYVIGRQAKIVTRLRQFFPEGVFEKGTRSTFRLDKPRRTP